MSETESPVESAADVNEKDLLEDTSEFEPESDEEISQDKDFDPAAVVDNEGGS